MRHCAVGATPSVGSCCRKRVGGGKEGGELQRPSGEGEARSCPYPRPDVFFVCFHLDGELAKPSESAAPSENTTTITTTPPPFPNPAVSSPTGGAPRLKRPTFLPIKNHARPALTSYDKQSPVGSGKGLEERSHVSLPPGRSATQRTPSCSSLGSLPNSMYQLPAAFRSLIRPSLLAPLAWWLLRPIATNPWNTTASLRLAAWRGHASPRSPSGCRSPMAGHRGLDAYHVAGARPAACVPVAVQQGHVRAATRSSTTGRRGNTFYGSLPPCRPAAPPPGIARRGTAAHATLPVSPPNASLTTPTVPTSSAGTVAGVTVVTSAITSTGATTTTTSAVTTTTPRGPTAASDVLVSRRNKALYGEYPCFYILVSRGPDRGLSGSTKVSRVGGWGLRVVTRGGDNRCW
ncbi:hypothetical protein E2C01_051465 [Portunus trituberculatus]|uniref:Uncharacterized protein n=1 Tax=Portunus trituberculatus TaxID=210409 RepID=A0A5B7GLU9_PORTR|nr:hypothetical protein [Portunus trituberculatus]